MYKTNFYLCKKNKVIRFSGSRMDSNLQRTLTWLLWWTMSVRVCAAMAVGLLLCTSWYLTILAGFYVLYCPVMYLMFFNQKWYRKIADILFSLWELYPVALFQRIYNTRLHHFGDYVNPDENTIIVLNHRTRIDWNYVWIALYHATHKPVSSEMCNCKARVTKLDDYKEKTNGVFYTLTGGKAKLKFVLKDEIKTIPGMGWIMQLNFFLYIKRNWREDQLNLVQFVQYYKKIGCPYRIVLFPEGTDLSEENRRRSEKYAAINNLTQYNFLLHPRTTGWAALCTHLRTAGLASVYDVTLAYDRPAQTEADLLRGKIPKHVYFHFKRYSIEEVPCDENDLKTWLNDRWNDKEASLRKFHKDGDFIDPSTNRAPTERAPRSLSLATIGFIFWTLIDASFIYGLFYSVIFQFWFLYHSLLFIFVTWYFEGFQNIQYKLLEKLVV